MLAHILGLNDPGGAWYLFWSGFGSDLVYVGAIAAAWHHLNCHETGCWRIARHRLGGYCRKHKRSS